MAGPGERCPGIGSLARVVPQAGQLACPVKIMLPHCGQKGSSSSCVPLMGVSKKVSTWKKTETMREKPSWKENTYPEW